MSLLRPSLVARWVIALALIATSAGVSQGQTTYTWFGNANTWGAAGNWDSGFTTLTSANSSSTLTRLVFVGSTGGIGNNTNSNNLTHTDAGLFQVNQITFGGFGDAFTLNGNGILLGGNGITVAGSNENNQLINLPITLAANQTWTNNRTATATFLTVAGNVTTGTNLLTLGGGGGIRLQTGTLTLGGGGVTVSNTGTVNLNGPIVLTAANTITKNNAGTFSVAGTINNGGFGLTLGGNGTSTYTGVISGAGGLTKTGTGLVVLSGLNSYTGATTITGGSLSVSNLTIGANSHIGNNNGSASFLLMNGGFLRYTGGDLTTVRQFTLGVNTIGSGWEANGSGTLSIADVDAGNNQFALNFDAADVARTLTLGGTNTGANSFQGLIANNGTGAVGLAKVGAGNWVLSGTNTYTGVTTISGGTLSVGVLANGGLTSSIGASTSDAANLVLNGGALVYTGGTQSTDRNFTLDVGGGTLNSSGTGALTFTNPAAIALTGTNTARTLTLTGTNDGSLAGILGNNGTGATSLTKNGTGTWTLNGVNAYTGTTTVNDGALILGVAGALNQGSSLTVNGNGVLDLGGFDLTVVGLNGNGRVRNTGANAALTINNTTDSTFSGVLGSTTPAGDGFSLVKNGAGTLTLSGVNTYTGSTTINAGVLSVGLLANGGTNSNIGRSSLDAANLVLNGGTLRYTGAAVSTDRRFTLGTNGGTIEANGTGALTFTDTTAITLLGTDTARTFTLTGSNTGANTLAGVLGNNGAGATSLTKAGAGTWVLTGTNTYSGVTSVTGGTLSVSADANLGSGAASNTLILNGGTLATTGSFTFSTTRGILVGPTSGSGAGTINVADTTTLTYGGVIANNTGGTGSLTKAGLGTLVLSGISNYGGATNLTAGTVRIGIADALPTTTTVAMTGTSTLELNGFNQSVVGLTGAAATQVVQNTSGTAALLTVNNAIANTFAGILGNTAATGDNFGLTKDGAGTLTLTGNNTYAGTTTISAGTLQVGNAGTTGSLGTGAVTNNAALIFSRSNAMTVANNISGTGSVTQAGAGTTTLTGTNSYAGATNISNGVLVIGNATALPTTTTATLIGTGILDLNGVTQTVAGLIGSTGTRVQNTSATAATLTVNNAIANTFGGVLGNTAATGDNFSLVKGGNGTFTLSGANTYTGSTTISAGTLSISSDANLGTAPGSATAGHLTINAGGTLLTTATGTITLNANRGLSLTGTGDATISVGPTGPDTVNYGGIIAGGTATNLRKTGNGLLVLSGINTYQGNTLLSSGGLVISADANLGSTTNSLFISDSGTGVLYATNSFEFSSTRNIFVGTTGTGGVGFIEVSPSQTLSYGGVIANNGAGTGGLTKRGTGNLVLFGNNTYSGVTTITAGTLQIGNGGTTGTLGGGAVTNNASLVFNRSDAVTVANNISGTGSVTQAGAGTTTLTGNNTYAGATNISNGVLVIGAAAAIPATTTVAMSGTGILDLNGVTQTVVGLTGVAGNRVQNTSATAATLTVNNAIANTFGGVLGNTAATGDNFAVAKGGAGTLTLAGDNTYTGTTTISGGVLQIGAGGTTGTLGGGAVTNDASLVFNRSDAVTVANNISGTGSVTQAGAGTTTLTGNNTYAGTTTISAGVLQIGNGGTAGTLGGGAVTNNASLAFNRSDAVTVANAISGTGGVTQAGAGTTTLTGANTYAGTTTISTGTLQVGNAGTTGTLGGGAVTNNASLVFNRSDAVTVANAISGTGSVTQAGAGTTTLTGANAYTGATAVNAGTLLVNGNQSAATGAVTVANTATLGGTGTLGGAVTANSGGTVRAGSPTNAIGTLTVGGLELQDGSTLGVRITPSGNNRVIVNGTTIGIDSTSANAYHLNVNVTGTTFVHSQQVTYLIMEGVDQNVSLNLPTTRYTFVGLTGSTWEAINVRLETGLNSDPTNLYLSFTPVPEPGTVLAVGAGLLGLGTVVRRRWKKATPTEATVAV